MKITFEPDEKVQQVAEAYALDMEDFARDKFKINLDRSDRSIERVEEILSFMHESYLKEKPDADKVMAISKMCGSYLGEVYRANHGCEWGIVSFGEEIFPGIKTNSGLSFWPWGRAQNRIINGPEDNIWHYYQHILENGENKSS